MTLLGSVFRDTVAAALLFGGAVWVGLITPQTLLPVFLVAILFGLCWIFTSYRCFAALALGVTFATNLGILILSMQQGVLTKDLIYALAFGGGFSLLLLWVCFRKVTNWFAKTDTPSA